MKSLHLLICCAPLAAATQSTFDPDGDSYAYAANAGWINFRPSAADGVVAGSSFFSGFAYAANFGWIHFGDGSPSNGHTYSNASSTDFGVNHDGAGNLTGYAYGTNIGWIHFGWAAPADPQRPRIDLFTGDLSGYAYAANIGWINLGAGFLKTTKLSIADTDNDGMDDAWEMLRGGSLSILGTGGDRDNDGVLDTLEYLADSNPISPAAPLRILAHTLSPSLTEMTLTFGTTRPTRLYRIEHDEDLAGAWTVWGTVAPDAGDSTTRIVNFTNTGRRFFRVSPVLPLQP